MNSKTTWTPGPWHFDKHARQFRVWCRGKVGSTGVADILVRRGIDSNGPSAEERANAQLIALAPEMAEALRKVTLYAEAMERALGQDSPRNVTLDEARSILSRLPVSQ